MIQEIGPARLDNHYAPLEAVPQDTALFFRDGQVLARFDEKNDTLVFPRREDFPGSAQAEYMFSIGNERFFLLFGADSVPKGFSYFTMPQARSLKRRENRNVFAVYTGFHLWKWYAASRFCGACGAETLFDRKERAKRCPQCGNVIYPRINPAVIVGVKNGDRLLLTRYKTGYAHNALVAGFTEIGETLEETVKREVMEEVGLQVKNIQYYKSQPWGVACDILMGFYCDVDGSDQIRRDDSELKSAEWVQREEIVLQPTDDSLTNEMMKMFKEGKQ